MWQIEGDLKGGIGGAGLLIHILFLRPYIANIENPFLYALSSIHLEK